MDSARKRTFLGARTRCREPDRGRRLPRVRDGIGLVADRRRGRDAHAARAARRAARRARSQHADVGPGPLFRAAVRRGTAAAQPGARDRFRKGAEMSVTTAARIDSRERLIVALDVPAPDAARALAERIGDAARFYKVGLELLTSGGSFELIQWLGARGNRIFADFKFFDIPETVRRAVANLRGRGVTFATVHGSRPIMEAAASAKGEVKILAVTLLTSMGPAELKEMGYGGTVDELVLSGARSAL